MIQPATLNTNLHSSKKDTARDLYLQGEKSQTAIAGQLGVHPKTLSYWIKQNNWKEIKAGLSLAPIMIQQNLYAQIQELQDHILNREDGNRFPDKHEVMMQYKMVAAIFKFPKYSFEEIKEICTELFQDKDASSKNITPKDKKTNNVVDSQLFTKNTADKEGIKKDKEEIKNEATQNTISEPIDPDYTPKKNVVLRSGARWIEKGIVYDPVMRQNRKLTKPEYDELLRKGLSKKDFAGWSMV